MDDMVLHFVFIFGWTYCRLGWAMLHVIEYKYLDLLEPPRLSLSPEIWPSGTPKSLEPSAFTLATTTVPNNRCGLHLPCLCNTKKHSKQRVSFLWMGNYKVFNYMERSTTGETPGMTSLGEFCILDWSLSLLSWQTYDWRQKTAEKRWGLLAGG